MNQLDLTPLTHLRTALEEVALKREVAIHLEDLLQTVTSRHEKEELKAREKECSHWNMLSANAQADLMVLEPTLFNSTLQANMDFKRLEKENHSSRAEYESLQIQIKSLQEEEDRLLMREDQKKAKRDVSVLPLHILRRAVSFLKCDEFASTLLVCRRWRYFFDQAYLWKVFMVRMEKQSIVEAKRREAEFEKMVPEPEEFKVECKQIKRGLQKGEIFQACLQAQQEELAHLKSIKEDIEGKIRARAKVHKFLGEELQKTTHDLGLKRIDAAQWEKRAYDSAQENKELAKRLQESDLKMREELASKQLIMESTGRTLAQINTKINVLQEIQSEINQGNDRDIQNATLKELVSKKKTQKKILKTTVKSLKDTLEKLVKETTVLQKIKKMTASDG
mmetsp:Transcript_15572/g.38412  ORF Transcript_15572/g.38412 Transcript_15572/m.38412 type:complete len:393 (-) Transcript_15572:177-1355(-)